MWVSISRYLFDSQGESGRRGSSSLRSNFFFLSFPYICIIKDIDMLLDDLDLRIWVSFFTAEIIYVILGYIAKWLKKPVEEAYQFWYKIKMKREKS